MSLSPIIDPETIENLKSLSPDDDGEFLKEIIGLYLDDTPIRIQELATGISSSDQAGAIRAAHTIKGSSSNIGASRVRALAEKIEHTCKAGLNQDVTRMVDELNALFDEAQDELKKLVR